MSASSSGDPEALAIAYYEAFNALDVDALRGLCSNEVALTVEGGRLQGIDELLTYVIDLHRHFPGIRTDARITAVTPQRVVCENGQLAPSGSDWQLDGRSCEVLDIEDGRIVEIRNYYVSSPHDRTGMAEVLRPGETFKLAQEQAALHRVASLVARGDPDPDAVFAAVNREIGLIVRADATSLFRFFADDTMQLVASWSRDDATFPLGDRRPMNEPMLDLRRTGLAQRFDVLPEGSPFLEEARAYGVKSAIGVPLFVEDQVWGVVFANSLGPQLFPPDTENRVLRFTALAGIALAHTRARASLAASRARVLAAADASRRRVQRDLHDGAQQRLLHTIVALKLAREAVAGHACPAVRDIDDALVNAEGAKNELHDLVRGILPAALTRHGLEAALESFAEPLPISVVLDVVAGRLPPAVETAAYFVIAEALTNVAKHARVDRAEVRMELHGGELRLRVRDEGVGGATPHGGTGLSGLADRIEACEGTLSVDSPPGGGTTILASIPT